MNAEKLYAMHLATLLRSRILSSLYILWTLDSSNTLVIVGLLTLPIASHLPTQWPSITWQICPMMNWRWWGDIVPVKGPREGYSLLVMSVWMPLLTHGTGGYRVCMYSTLPFMGNIWQRKILVNRTGTSYWWGKIWWISNSWCICHIYFLWILVRKILVNMAHDLPNLPIFPCQNFPMYSIRAAVLIMSVCSQLNVCMLHGIESVTTTNHY